MKHQIMTVMLDAFLIINALPPKFLQKRSPYFFHGAFAPSFIWSRRPCVCVLVSVFLCFVSCRIVDCSDSDVFIIGL